MKNLINGHRLEFGSRPQIEWLKRQRRLQEAIDRGTIVAVVEWNPIGARYIKDQVVTVRFQCPGCLMTHKFSFPLLAIDYDYVATCGVVFTYEGEYELLKVESYQDKLT